PDIQYRWNVIALSRLPLPSTGRNWPTRNETELAIVVFSLSLSSNGVAVLRMLSLDKAAFAAGSAVSKWALRTKNSRRLSGGLFTSSGVKSIFIKRIPLNNILSEEVERQGIVIRRGKKLQGIERTPGGGVIAKFQDGSTASGDLIVGADGVHS